MACSAWSMSSLPNRRSASPGGSNQTWDGIKILERILPPPPGGLRPGSEEELLFVFLHDCDPLLLLLAFINGHLRTSLEIPGHARHDGAEDDAHHFGTC